MITLLLTVSISCIKEIDLDLKDDEPKIVLNAIISADSLIKINITRSLGILEEDKLYNINNATVLLYKENIFIDTLNQYSAGYYYKSGLKSIVGANYKIIVKADGYKTVESLFTMPNKPEILEFDTINYSGTGDVKDGDLEIALTFSNQLDKKNYYMLEARNNYWEYYFDYQYYDIYDSIFFNSAIQLSTNDPKFEIIIDYDVYPASESSDYNNWGKKFVFSDQYFNDQMGEVKFKINGNYQSNLESQRVLLNGSVDIILSEISEDFYRYLQSLSYYSDDPFENFFVEKPTTVSNVAGGMGIIASKSSSVASIKLN